MRKNLIFVFFIFAALISSCVDAKEEKKENVKKPEVTTGTLQIFLKDAETKEFINANSVCFSNDCPKLKKEEKKEEKKRERKKGTSEPKLPPGECRWSNGGVSEYINKEHPVGTCPYTILAEGYLSNSINVTVVKDKVASFTLFLSRKSDMSVKINLDKPKIDIKNAIKKTKFNDLLKEASDYLEKAQYKEALESCNSVFRIFRDKEQKGKAQICSALVYIKMGEYEKALKSCGESKKFSAKSEKGYICKGLAFLSKNEYEKAIKEFTKAIEKKPDYAEIFYIRAIAYYQLNNTDSAKDDYKKSVELKPKLANESIENYNLDFLIKTFMISLLK